MRLLAPAKINLHLRVGKRADDGFHRLSSWMCTVGLFDSLVIEDRDAPGVSLDCDDQSLPCGTENLVVRAAEALPRASRGARISLEKRIPVGGGLGGGSSDAATTLLALNQLWKLDLTAQQLSSVAARLGSDVPFFLVGCSCVCTGRGQIVRPIARPAAQWALLVLSDLPLPTPDVYRRFAELELGDDSALTHEPEWSGWAELPSAQLLPRLVNDLESAAFSLRPDLAALHARLHRLLDRPIRMSGSGSSLFTLYDDRGAADAAARAVQSGESVRALAVEIAPTIDDDLVRGDAKL